MHQMEALTETLKFQQDGQEIMLSPIHIVLLIQFFVKAYMMYHTNYS